MAGQAARAGMAAMFLDQSRQFRAALSPDGRLLAATRGRAVHVWDAASGALRHTFRDEGPSALGGIADLTFTADGRGLVTVGAERRVIFWDLTAGKKTRQVDGDEPGAPGLGRAIRASGGVALAPGGRYLAFEEHSIENQSSVLKVRDLTTGKEVGEARLPVGGAKGLTFAADGKTLAWASFGDGIFLWDCTAGKEPRRIGAEQNARRHMIDIESLAFAPDGKTLAACRSDQTVQLWDVAAGKLLHQIGRTAELPETGTRVVVRIAGTGQSASPIEMAFTADGKTLATTLGGVTVRRFNTSTGTEIAPAAAGHAGAVTDLCLAPDGRTLTTFARHDSAHVWDLATGREVRQVRLPAGAAHVARDAGGQYVATSLGGAVTLWDAATGKEAGKIDPGFQGVVALAVSPDGKTVATRPQQANEVHLWDRATGQRRHTLTGTASEEGGNAQQVFVTTELTGVLCVDLVFSPDGRYLAGTGPKRQLCLWDVASGTLIWELDLPTGQVVERFTFTAGGLAVAAVNRDGTVGLYETATGTERCRLGQPTARPATPTALMMGGARLMVSGLPGQGAAPVAVASSSDGRFLATAHTDPTIHLWDVVTGQEVGQFKGHQGGVVTLAFSNDGERLISGSLDTTALVWNLGGRLRAARPTEEALTPQQLETLWTDLGSPDARRAFAAQRQLARHPAEAAGLAREHLRPAAGVNAERLAQLVANLDSRDFASRQRAASELESLGDQARPALEKALAGDVSLEVRQRVERLLRKATGKPAASLVRDLRVVEALELARGAEGRRELQALAQGAPGARLTREAGAALQRLGQ
jgi:WD40 repeat protein